jgi:hypothetical protein
MPLDLPGLTSDLTTFFSALPATEALCAAEWKTAIRSYTTAIVPVVAAPAQDAAAAAFETALAGMSAPGAGIAIFDTAFGGYAAALAAAMAPPGTPPPALLSVTLAPVFIANSAPGVTHAAAATAIAGAVNGWFLTGKDSGGGPWV